MGILRAIVQSEASPGTSVRERELLGWSATVRKFRACRRCFGDEVAEILRTLLVWCRLRDAGSFDLSLFLLHCRERERILRG